MSSVSVALKYASLGYEALRALASLPWWILSSIPRSRRPRPSWGLFNSVYYKGLRYLISRGIALASDHDHRAIKQERNIHGVWVDPVPTVLGEIGELAKQADILAVPIPGYWLYRTDTEAGKGVVELAKDGEKVLYTMHGGGYMVSSAHPDDPCSIIGKDLLRRVDSGPHLRRVFSIEYRLSQAAQFPAQIIDALAGYHYLVHTVGFKPENIILAGDSAGGNLALALARYLAEYAPELKPGAMLLLSPWCDLSVLGQDTESMLFDCDYIPRDTSYPVSGFAGLFGIQIADTSRWMSPARAGHFEGFPKAYIISGGAEIFRDQIRELAAKMQKDSGPENVKYVEMVDAVHDTLVMLRFEPETRMAFEGMAKWIREL